MAAAAFADRIAAARARGAAFAFFDRDRALAEAKAAPAGPLAGVTFGVKDVIDTVDMPTSYGSAVYEGHRPLWDAPAVALTRAFGGVVMGKTVTVEFAMKSPGKTRNPHNTAHTPAVRRAAPARRWRRHGAGCLRHADAGSILRPSSYCGVVGYKPSFGVLNRAGVKPLSDTLDHLGLVTRDVRDAAFVTAALAERPELAQGTAPRAPRIGLVRTSRWAQAEPATRDALARAAAAIEAAGGTVRELEVPESFERLYALFDAVMGFETPRTLAYEHRVLGTRISPITLDFIETLSKATRADYDAALAALKTATRWSRNCSPAAMASSPPPRPARRRWACRRATRVQQAVDAAACAGAVRSRRCRPARPAGRRAGDRRIGADAETLALAAFIEDALKAAA